MRRYSMLLGAPLFLLACNGRILLGELPEDAGSSVGHSGGLDAGESSGDAAFAPYDAAPVVSSDPGVRVQSDPDGGHPTSCGTPDGTRHVFSSTADVSDRLHGLWATCGGAIDQPPDAVGIEFADPYVFFLVPGPNGTVMRGNGGAYTRTIDIADAGDGNGGDLGYYPIELSASTWSYLYTVESFDSPTKLRLTEQPTGKVVEYTPFTTGANLCSFVGGTWDVTNAFYGNDASFQFFADGTFIGGSRSTPLPAEATYAGYWQIDPDGELAVWQTIGLQCTQYDTHMYTAFSADCQTVTLDDHLDNCTGSRKYFEGTGTIFTRR